MTRNPLIPVAWLNLYLGVFYFYALAVAVAFPCPQYAGMTWSSRATLFLTAPPTVMFSVWFTLCLGVVLFPRVTRVAR